MSFNYLYHFPRVFSYCPIWTLSFKKSRICHCGTVLFSSLIQSMQCMWFLICECEILWIGMDNWIRAKINSDSTSFQRFFHSYSCACNEFIIDLGWTLETDAFMRNIFHIFVPTSDKLVCLTWRLKEHYIPFISEELHAMLQVIFFLLFQYLLTLVHLKCEILTFSECQQ